MATERVAKILRSKTNLSDEEIKNTSDAEGWKIIYSVKNPTVEIETDPQICFTGFSPAEKNLLAQAAHDSGLKLVKTITKKLDILCCGPNAGPSKKAKAQERGATLLTQEEFIDFIKK